MYTLSVETIRTLLAGTLRRFRILPFHGLVRVVVLVSRYPPLNVITLQFPMLFAPQLCILLLHLPQRWY